MGESFDHRPAGWDQTEPQMSYLTYPQPYGSELSVKMSSVDFGAPDFCFLISEP